MKHSVKLVVLAVVAAALLAGAQAFAGATQGPALSSSIDVEQSSFTMTDEVAVTFALTNRGEASVRVLRWLTPLRGISNDLFVVTRDGEPVAYTGRLVKWAAPTDGDYIEIAAGETVSSVIDLSSVYDMSVTGNYSVRYRAFLNDDTRDPFAMETEAGATADDVGFVTSNQVALFVEGHELKTPIPEDDFAMGITGIGGYTSCSNSQKTALQTAHANAGTISTKGYNNLVSYPTGSTLYKTWFGTYTSSRFSTVKSHFTSLKSTFASKTFTFDCSCTDSAYAYVYPTQPYKVYLCQAFWSAPAMGRDSKAGTLVHETSHFNAVASTQDYVYGATAAKNLAKTNPSKAVKNADNHEYFAEDQP
jgi:peptidyl-Lys metalloendopeptidase